MEWYHWVIIGLIAYLYFFYTSPDKAKMYIDQGIDKGKSLVELGQEKLAGDSCPNDNVTVCGVNNVTYQNRCAAEKAGVNYYLGGC